MFKLQKSLSSNQKTTCTIQETDQYIISNVWAGVFQVVQFDSYGKKEKQIIE
jgi:hypothetical protein